MWPLLLEASGMQQKGDENGAGKKSNKRTPGPRFSSAISTAPSRAPEILTERAGWGARPQRKVGVPFPQGSTASLPLLASKNALLKKQRNRQKKICKRFHFLNNCAALSCKASRRPDYKGGHLRFWKDLCFPLKAYF